MTQDEVIVELKKMLNERLRIPQGRVETLEPDSLLLQDGLGLDSLDCVELLLGIEDEFDITFDEEEEGWVEYFSTLEKLSELVLSMKSEHP